MTVGQLLELEKRRDNEGREQRYRKEQLEEDQAMTTGDLIMAPITVATSTFGTAVSIVDSTVASIVGHDLDAQQKKEATDAVIRE